MSPRSIVHVISLWALCALTFLSCRSYVNWNNHTSFRSQGKDMQLSQVDPSEVLQGKISANLHYASVALDSVFFRDLPGLFGRSVAFGLEITGVLKDGKAIKTVLNVSDSVGEHSFLSFNNVVSIQPFLYTGQNITITLHFRVVPKSAASNIKGRLQGAGDKVRSINPMRYAALDTGIDLFSSIISSALGGKEMAWKYTFTLHPVDSTMRDKPDMLFTAARHILLCMPPTNAPKAFKKLKPRYLLRMLKLRGNRLVWRKSGDEYDSTPYIILNITRYKRYPKGDTKLRQMARLVDNLTENGNYELARSNLRNLGVAINDDPVITENERNLERTWLDFRRARIEAALAEKGGDHQKRLEQLTLQIRHLGMIRRQFDKVLYPYEIKKIEYKASRLIMTGEQLARKVGGSVQELKNAIELYKIAVRKTREKPKPSVVKARAKVVLKKIPLPDEEDMKNIRFTPLGRKWWFWTILGVAAAGAGVGGYLIAKGASSSKTVLNPGALLPFKP